MKQQARGFSLVELLIVVVIIGVLAAVAIPAYGNYVTRSRLSEAFTGLGTIQTSAEEYWSNNHTYAGLDTATPSRMPPNSVNFIFSLNNTATASSYTATATGQGTMQGFVFTIDQNGNRATTRVPAGYTTNASCWIDRKGGQCVQ